MKHFTSLVLVLVTATAFAGGQIKTMGKEAAVIAQTGAWLPPAKILSTDIFVQGFNDTVATNFPPSGWIMINLDGNVHASDTAWYSSRTTGGTGTLPPYEGAAFAAAYFGTANVVYLDDWLITPNTGGTAPPGSFDSLTFWLTARLSASGNYPDSLDIRVSSTGRNANDFTVRLAYVLAPKARWTRFAFPLPITTNRYIAFRYLIYDGGATGANSDKICLDDVRISRFPTTAVAEEGPLPERFALSQNYPNPFNPNTTIRFQLESGGRTTLRVYNALGEEVDVVLDEELAPGTYSVRFDATALSSGVYFYRLTSGSFVAAKHMLLIK